MINSKVYALKNYLENQKKNSTLDYYNITKQQFDLLSQITNKLKPNNILEIGTSNGYSLLSIYVGICNNSSNSKNVSITTVEVNEERAAEASKVVDEINSDLITVKLINDNIYNSSCVEILKKNAPFDFVFVDCNQREYNQILDLVAGNGLLSQKSSILFDNILSHEASYNFYTNTDFEKQGFRSSLFPLHDGFLHLIKKD